MATELSQAAGSIKDRTAPYVVVSADCHAGPRVRDYAEFVEPKYLREFEDYATQVERYDAGLAASTSGGAAMTVSDVRNTHPGLSDPDERLKMLEADGIVAEIVYPQGAVPFHPYPAISEPRGKMAYQASNELRFPGIRTYNRWLANLCAAHPGRHHGIGIIPIRDVEAAVREARWIRENGLAGVSLPVLGDDVATYNDPVYEPLWSVCEELELPLNVHGGAGRYYGRGPTATAIIVAECDWFTRRALWMLIFAGVFERHPNLKLVFTEQRTHWVAPTLEDLDSIWRSSMVDVRRVIPRSPSEYFHSNVYVGASFMSPRESAARHDVGVDRLMWGSDFPHVEGAWPFTRLSYRHTFSELPDEDRRAILGLNAIDCYGLDAQLLLSAAEKIGPSAEAFAAPTTDLPPEALASWAFRRTGAFD